MGRTIGAIFAGLATWVVVASLLSLTARFGWPGYAEAEPNRHYDMAMLIARLMSGAVATLVAGAVVGRLAGNGSKALPVAAFLIFAVSLADHVRIWDQYPAWYHLVYLGYLIPLTLLGGRLVGRRRINVLGVST